MRTVFRTATFRPRRIVRGVALFVGLFAVIGLAMVGAVIALGVIAIGAVVHTVLSLVRNNPTPAPASTGTRVIEGEYRVVVDAGARSGKPLVQTT
jgi:hypothetical protein